jgi:membrane-associated phospholipid phosphatase
MNRHLHPALVQLLLGLFSCIFFAAIAALVNSKGPITVFDENQAVRFDAFARQHPAVVSFAAVVTQLGAGLPRAIVVVAVAALLLLHRQWRLAIFWAATQLLMRDIVDVLKNSFERPRPDFAGNFEGWSFPSGHTAGAMTTYGMLAYLIALHWSEFRARWLAVFALACIILMVGLSRMVLGVHYFTDVLGGYFLAIAYISFCVAGIEWGRTVRNPSAASSTATSAVSP